MKIRILCGAGLLTLLTVSATARTYMVTAQTMVSNPVSPLLAGHFVELGYGFQVEPMMAEMFFNRSFEPYMPYRDNSIKWFGLYYDERNPSKGYRTNWKEMGWYHSGYEHNSWFAAPGTEGPFHIDRNSTFFVLRSPQRNVEIELTRDKADVRQGLQALRLHNRETKQWGALAQEGKYLRKGESYLFTGLLKSRGRPVRVEVRFYPSGNWDRPIAVLPLGEIGTEYSEKRVSFQNPSFQGHATFSLWIPPGAVVTMDDFSLLPASNFHGWRKDVIDLIAELKPGVTRFPGGCFTSFYDWRNGVGPLRQRPPEASYFWGGMNTNELGTDEFAAMCKRVGSEMMFAVNMYHPKKRDYLLTVPDRLPENATHSFDMSRFTDLEKGAREAADWVAYCNLPAGRHPMADLRVKNGYREPWGVKYWELDQELNRWFTPEEYAKAAVLYSKAMKTVDPTIKTGLMVYWKDREEVLPGLLETAGRDVDFLLDRVTSSSGLDELIAPMRKFNSRNGTHLFCANEWHPELQADDRNEYIAVRSQSMAERFDRMSRWITGLKVLRAMMAWQRRGGDLQWVNLTNLSNTHGQSAIETPKETVFLTASGVAMDALAHSPAAWPLRIEGYEAKGTGEFEVQAAWDRNRKRLVLDALNMTAQPHEAAFDLSALGREFHQALISVTGASSPDAKNTPEQPGSIKRDSRTQADLSVRGTYAVSAKPWSFTEIVLQ